MRSSILIGITNGEDSVAVLLEKLVVAVIVVELEKELIAANLKEREVMFTVRVIVFVELTESANGIQDQHLVFMVCDSGCQHDPTAGEHFS